MSSKTMTALINATKAAQPKPRIIPASGPVRQHVGALKPLSGGFFKRGK